MIWYTDILLSSIVHLTSIMTTVQFKGFKINNPSSGFRSFKLYKCLAWVCTLFLVDIFTRVCFLLFEFGPNQGTSGNSSGHTVTRSILTVITWSSGLSTGLTTKQFGCTSRIPKGLMPVSCSFLGSHEACTPWHVHQADSQWPWLVYRSMTFDVPVLFWYCVGLVSRLRCSFDTVLGLFPGFGETHS